jgi:peptide/nickel transport system substrate-binding protein
MSYLYDSLLWQDSTGALLPWLASGFDGSADGLTYTFDIRDNAFWHDGQPVTPDDVIFTFDYFAAQSGLSPLLLAQPHNVRAVRAAGPHRVEIRLDAPVVTFAGSVAGALPIIPRHIWSSIADPSSVQDPKVLVGSGPYRLKSYSSADGSYSYTANDSYFLGRPFVKGLGFHQVGDDLTAVLAGDLDAGDTNVQGVGPDALAPFRSQASFGVIQDPTGFTFPLFWNLAKEGPLADVRFRRACAMAISRNDIVRRLLGGNGLPGNPGFLPPNHPYHVNVEQYSYDLAGANRMLDEAGYPRTSSGIRKGPNGQPVRFSLLAENAPVPPALDVVVGALHAVGIELSTQAVDLPTLFTRTLSGDFDLAITLFPGPSRPGPNGDPDYLRTIYSSTAAGFNSVHGYVNPQLDALLEHQLLTQDPNQRRSLIAQIQQIVARDLPVLPLYYSTQYNVFKRSVFDQWYYTPGGFAGGIPSVYNKQVLVTGRKTGERARPTT